MFKAIIYTGKGTDMTDNNYTKNSKMNPKHYILCAFFAAFIAVLSQIQIPLPFTPIPISLGVLAIIITGGVLGVKKGLISIVVYILLGIIGIPVFTGFQGGISALAGPTGGYIIGYIPMGVIVAAITSYAFKNSRDKKWPIYIETALVALGAVIGAFVCYVFGTAWFMFMTGNGLMESLVMCVIPFIPGEIIKIIAFVVIMEALKKPIAKLVA